jgi:hypothetical protein
MKASLLALVASLFLLGGVAHADVASASRGGKAKLQVWAK